MKSKRALRVLMIRVTLVGLLAGGLASCKGEDTEVPREAPPAEAATETETAQEKPSANRPIPLREHLTREIALPDAYPDDAPVYPGAKVSSEAWHAGRLSVAWSSEDTVDEVRGHVSQQLRSKGWLGVTESEMDSGVMIDAAKDAEARRISVMIAGIDEDMNDSLTLILVITDPRS